MWAIERATLLDDIFLSNFNLYRCEQWSVIYDSSELLDAQKINKTSPKMAFPARIFKDQFFYFIIETEVYLQYGSALSDIVLGLIQNINRFLEDLTLKKGFPQVGKPCDFDIQKFKLLDDVVGYMINAQFKDKEKQFFFSFFLPRKTLDHFIALLVKKNISKIDNRIELNGFLVDMRSEFFRRSINFPLDVVDFFNHLMNQDFQRILGLLITNNLMSYDMLWALGLKIDNGSSRIQNNLSKNQKQDFLEACAKASGAVDFRWVEIALYQIGLSLDQLIREKKMESLEVERIKKVLEDISLMDISFFFSHFPFEYWIEHANKEAILPDLLFQTSDLLLAKSLTLVQNNCLSLVEKNLSKRKWQYLKEDIEYQKNNIQKNDRLKAQYEVFKILVQLKFIGIPGEYKRLDLWLSRFEKLKDFYFAVDYVGPIDFSLAILSVPASLKKWVIKNLKPPLKYFVAYFLANKIKFGFPYGELRIKEAENWVIRSLFQLEVEKKINLIPFDELDKREALITLGETKKVNRFMFQK